MDNPEVIIGLLIGAFLGGVIGWLLGSRKSARAEAEREATQTRIEEQRKAFEEQLAMVRKVNDQAISQLKDSFKALSVDALKEAQPALVERLEKFQAVTMESRFCEIQAKTTQKRVKGDLCETT